MFEFNHFAESMLQLRTSASKNADVALFQELDTLYSEATRFYHDKTHVAECLTNFQHYRNQAVHPAEIEVAIWYHDAIYDTKAPDNEEQSAALAERSLSKAKVANASITRIVEMILATKTHEVSSPDSELMVDIDLGILGTPAEVFEHYDQNIRKEYHWVPRELYGPGRIKVLQSFLDRDVIFHTQKIHNRLEAQARANLTNKLAELSAL